MDTPKRRIAYLFAVIAVLIWLAIEHRAGEEAQRAQLQLQAELQRQAAENARLRRALERQSTASKQLGARLERQQSEIDACDSVCPRDGSRPAVGGETTASAEVRLQQVDDRVEVAPGGPMTPITQ